MEVYRDRQEKLEQFLFLGIELFQEEEERLVKDQERIEKEAEFKKLLAASKGKKKKGEEPVLE